MTQTRRGVLLSSLWAITTDHLGTVRVGGGGLVSKSCQTLVNPWTVACQALLSMGLLRQEYWSGCHFLLQGILLTQESNPGLLHCRQIIYPLSYAVTETYRFLIGAHQTENIFKEL